MVKILFFSISFFFFFFLELDDTNVDVRIGENANKLTFKN